MTNQLVTKRKIQQGIMKYALCTIAIVLIGGYFGFQHYNEYQAASTALSQENQKLAELKGAADKIKKEYGDLKKDMDKANSGVNESIEKILPASENFTDLARDLDKYFLNTSMGAAPMFLSDLRFNAARVGAEEFATLPFSMNISGDEVGLKQFLDFIEKSGDLNSRSRLLDIASVTLSYQNKPAATDDNSATATPTALSAAKAITASINLNAYFQKPLDNNSTATNK
jgi:cell division protein FtsB